jgi:hypothetical protein
MNVRLQSGRAIAETGIETLLAAGERMTIPSPTAKKRRAEKGARAASPRADSWNNALKLQPKRGARGGPERPAPAPGPGPSGVGFIGNRPSRCNLLRASLRARRIASAFSRAFLSEGFS